MCTWFKHSNAQVVFISPFFNIRRLERCIETVRQDGVILYINAWIVVSQQHTICVNILSLRLKYFIKPTDDKTKYWISSWLNVSISHKTKSQHKQATGSMKTLSKNRLRYFSNWNWLQPLLSNSQKKPKQRPSFSF